MIEETGGTKNDYERQQWDSGNNLVAVEPGVVIAYDRGRGGGHCRTRRLIRDPVN